MSVARRYGELVGAVIARGWRWCAAAAGGGVVVWGVDQWSRPAAACIAGAALLAIAAWPAARGRAA